MNNDYIFVKFHKYALTSGLIGALGSERWQTLSALALFINEKGECFPSQDLIADYLGIRRETVNRRIKALCDFQWHGRSIIVKEQAKHPKKKTYLQNTYYISADCGFKFGSECIEPCDVDDSDRVTLM